MNIDDIRNEDGTLPAYAWPGGYPIIYFASDDGVLCPKCANDYKEGRDTEEQLKPVAADIYYEGPTIQCEHCNADIESAYGDPILEEKIMNIDDFARDPDTGWLPEETMGLPLVYFDEDDDPLCNVCATVAIDHAAAFPAFRPVTVGIFYEGAVKSCVMCGKLLFSAEERGRI